MRARYGEEQVSSARQTCGLKVIVSASAAAITGSASPSKFGGYLSGVFIERVNVVKVLWSRGGALASFPRWLAAARGIETTKIHKPAPVDRQTLYFFDQVLCRMSAATVGHYQPPLLLQLVQFRREERTKKSKRADAHQLQFSRRAAMPNRPLHYRLTFVRAFGSAGNTNVSRIDSRFKSKFSLPLPETPWPFLLIHGPELVLR